MTALGRGVRTATRPRVLEKDEQQQILKLIAMLGGKYYTLGTRRKRPPTGFVLATREQKREFFGTRQTPGVADVLAFFRLQPSGRLLVFIEAKAEHGRMSDDQIEFREMCLAANVAHVVGGLNALIAFLIERGLLSTHQVPHYRVPEHLREVRS